MKKNPNGFENCLLLQLYTVFVNKETQLLIIIFVSVFSNTVLSLTIQYVYIYIYIVCLLIYNTMHIQCRYLCSNLGFTKEI